MPKSRKPRNTGCPFAYSLDVFGDRWSLIIIRDMLFQGFQTYGEFQSSQEGIATNILADRLAHLEANGLISKTRDPKNGRRNLYHLTEKGADLGRLMLEIARWGAKYDPQTTAKDSIMQRIEDDPDTYAAQLKSDAIARAENPETS